MKTLKKRHKELKKKCDKLKVTLKSFNSANPEDICILSDNEYDLLDKKANVENKDSYFVSENDYERYFLESDEGYNQ